VGVQPSVENDVLVLPLEAAEATLERVGGKGASLARLAQAGLPVPPGFHITTAAYRRFVAAHGLQPSILEAAGDASPDDPASLERAATRIQASFDSAAMPDDLAAPIRRAYAELGARGTRPAPAVAVRSSATAEDLPELSFAGQQETFLNVRGEADLLEAIKRCWASLWTARAIGYRARHHISSDDVSLAVVVQELVPADAAGVLFTADPVSGARDRVLINAAWGLGEAVVGGLVTPDTLTLDKTTGVALAQQVADKAVMTVRSAEGVSTQPVPEGRRHQPVLTPDQALELARLGGRIEGLWGQPMDVEWALSDSHVSILQARPITSLPEPARTSTAWQLPNSRAKYFRTSVVELLPDPLSPLFATLGLPKWNAALIDLARTFPNSGSLNAFLRDWQRDYGLTTINGYAFYGWQYRANQIPGVLMLIVRIPPVLRQARLRWQNQARPAYESIARRWEAQDLAQVPAVGLVEGVHEIATVAARHYLTIQSGILPVAYMSESLFSAVYDRFIRRRGDPPALTFLLGFDSAPLRAEQSLYNVARWAREHAGLSTYLRSTPGGHIAADLANEAAPPGVVAEDWQEFRSRFSANLAEFGHAIYDLDFAKALPADEPAPLLETLRHFLRDDVVDPRQRQAAAVAEREKATLAMRRKLRGPRQVLFRRLLAPAQRFAPLREDALADVGRGWPVLRRMLREVGRRLAAAGAIERADDVFWLTATELQTAAVALDARRPVEPFGALVAQRRATWQAQRRLTPPVALPEGGGMKLFGLDWSRFAPARSQQAEGNTIRGIGTSPGRVTGTARVVGGPDEFGSMQPGEILVARITTPAWTPLFALASGVVTDVGGPLSHGSIVAREYHIPAVLGTGVATERIRAGRRIAVDGDAGTVQLLD
jgi:rifampicin phosphotransferase